MSVSQKKLSEQKARRNSGDTMFLDPQVAATVESLELVARFIVEGYLIGLHRSPLHGFSSEFASYREYVAGDDLRHLDWKLKARTDRNYLKQFEENTNTSVQILLDCSGSMATGATSEQVSKFQYAKQLTAALIYLAQKQSDAFSLLAFSDSVLIEPRAQKTQAHKTELLELLSEVQAGGETEIQAHIELAGEVLQKKSIAIIISDFLTDLKETETALSNLRQFGHEVIAFQILSPSELTFPFTQNIEFTDAETDERITADADAIKPFYQQAFGAHQEKLKEICGTQNIDFSVITTDTTLDIALTNYLASRKRLRT